MLATSMLSAAEQHRIGVYVLAGIVGLAVTGLISIARAARRRA
jgi:hypothetical protein